MGKCRGVVARAFARRIRVLASNRSFTRGSFKAPYRMETPALSQGAAYVAVH